MCFSQKLAPARKNSTIWSARSARFCNSDLRWAQLYISLVIIFRLSLRKLKTLCLQTTNLFTPRNKVEVGWAVWEERWSQPASTHHSELPWSQKRHPQCSEMVLRVFIVTKESGTFGRYLVIPSSAIKIAISHCTIFSFLQISLPESKFCRDACLPLCFQPRRLTSRDWRKVSFVDSASKQPPGERPATKLYNTATLKDVIVPRETCNTTLQHSNTASCGATLQHHKV